MVVCEAVTHIVTRGMRIVSLLPMIDTDDEFHSWYFQMSILDRSLYVVYMLHRIWTKWKQSTAKGLRLYPYLTFSTCELSASYVCINWDLKPYFPKEKVRNSTSQWECFRLFPGKSHKTSKRKKKNSRQLHNRYGQTNMIFDSKLWLPFKFILKTNREAA